jgi:signal transduction histidine kinase
MVPVDIRTLLLGADRKRARQWSIGAGILFLASLLYFAVVRIADFRLLDAVLWWQGYAVLLTVFVAVQAYSNGGIGVSWLLVFAAVAGVILNYGGIALTRGKPGLPWLIGYAIVGSVVAAAILGTLGAGIGTAVRRITR